MSGFPLDAVGELPEEQRAMMMAAMEQMQMRDSLKMYNNLVEKCFRECIEDMKSKSLSKSEEQCVGKCCEKFMNVTSRVGMRFGEFLAEMEKQAKDHLSKQMAQGK